jgi:hypothetical protein
LLGGKPSPFGTIWPLFLIWLYLAVNSELSIAICYWHSIAIYCNYRQ